MSIHFKNTNNLYKKFLNCLKIISFECKKTRMLVTSINLQLLQVYREIFPKMGNRII